MRFPVAVFASALLLNACTTPAPHGSSTDTTSAPADMNTWRSSLRQRTTGMSDAASTATAGIPIVGSPALAREWGAPHISKSADGSFRLRYMQKGKLYGLVCLSLTTPVSNPESAPAWLEEFDDPLGNSPVKLHPQEWQQARVAGHNVNWFQMDGGGGADFPTYSTWCFVHTDASHRTGYYVVQAWSDTPEKAAEILGKAAFLTGN